MLKLELNSLEVLALYSEIKLYNNLPKRHKILKCNQSLKIQINDLLKEKLYYSVNEYLDGILDYRYRATIFCNNFKSMYAYNFTN